jgi:Tfp pilus assembly protein PilP
VRFGVLAATVALALLTACGDGSEPKASDSGEKGEEVVKRIDRDQASKEAGKKATKVASAASAFGAPEGDFTYDPTGKRDPFRSFEWERPDRRHPGGSPRTPLEKFDLSQLDVVAVVWRTDNAKALVQDPAGQSYIVGYGAKIGKNDGRITRIEDNLVVVKETYVDHLGQKTRKDIEMRIRGSEGG